MNISKNHHKVFLIAVVILFIGMYVIIFRNNKFNSNITNNKNFLREYNSTFMGIYIKFPEYYKIKDINSIITLTKGQNNISITLNNSNYENLQEYLAFYDETRQISKIIELIPNKSKYDSVGRIFKIGTTEQKSYFFYKNYQVIILSTSSPDLYDDLDQIAASFEYLGDTSE